MRCRRAQENDTLAVQSVESCNTGIKLTKSLILKLILKLQLRSIDIKFGQSPAVDLNSEPEQLHHVKSMFGL